MIRRDKRNIGKIVKVDRPYRPFNSRIGKVVGFRGDFLPRIPYVEVFIYDKGKTTGSVHPFPGGVLQKV